MSMEEKMEQVGLDDPQEKLNVIIAVDSSVYSKQALQFYIEHLHRPEYDVMLLHAAELPKITEDKEETEACVEKWKLVVQKEKDKVKEIEQEFAKILASKQVSSKVKAVFGGTPGEVVVTEATKQKASLIVTGTRGQGRIRRTVLGSVSDYILHHAHCPVLICAHSKA